MYVRIHIYHIWNIYCSGRVSRDSDNLSLQLVIESQGHIFSHRFWSIFIPPRQLMKSPQPWQLLCASTATLICQKKLHHNMCTHGCISWYIATRYKHKMPHAVQESSDGAFRVPANLFIYTGALQIQNSFRYLNLDVFAVPARPPSEAMRNSTPQAPQTCGTKILIRKSSWMKQQGLTIIILSACMYAWSVWKHIQYNSGMHFAKY